MQNKLLSITRNIIPYIKELRPIAGSIMAVILWQQLDYWFSKSPKHFYKFLSPPQTDHEKYRIGDSWTEELGFSEKEFRNAFDKIGARHISKGAFNSTENPFIKDGKEMFFCSYHDKIKRMTFYFRNHKFADKVLDKLVKSKTYNEKVQGEFIGAGERNLENAPKGSSTIRTETIPENNNNPLIEDDKFKQVFSPEERPAAQKFLSSIPETKQGDVLAVLFAMIKTSTIANKVGYLRAIVKSVTTGTFTPLSEKNRPKRQLTAEEKERKAEKEQLIAEKAQKAKDDNLRRMLKERGLPAYMDQDFTPGKVVIG